MDKRTGWSRRWFQAHNPILEALEERLVLTQPAALDLKPLLSEAEQHSHQEKPNLTIDTLVKAAAAKTDMPSIPPHDLERGPGPPPHAEHFLQHDSLTEAHPTLTSQPVSTSMEATVFNLAPPAAADVALALKAFASAASQVAGDSPTSPSAEAAGAHHNVGPPADTPANPHETAADTPDRNTDASPAANPDAPQADARTAPPARPAAPDANAIAAQQATSADASRGQTSQPPSPPSEPVQRQTPAGVTAADTMRFMAAGASLNSVPVRETSRESQGLAAADFATLGPEASLETMLPGPPEKSSMGSTDDAPLRPLSGDLLVDFLPYNVAALRSALESLCSEIEQVCLTEGGREGLGLGLLVAALATSGMAGHAAWERIRGERDRRGTHDDLNAVTETWHHFAGLSLPEMP